MTKCVNPTSFAKWGHVWGIEDFEARVEGCELKRYLACKSRFLSGATPAYFRRQ